MKTTTVVTSLTRRAAARFLMIAVSHVAPSINQLRVALANESKIVTRLAILGTNPRRALTVAAIIAIGAAIGPAPAFAVVITVSNTADSGAGSLRAALANANDGDTIDATGVTGTVTLTSGQLNVTDSVKILGPGADMLAVDGNFAGRVFYIGPGKTVSIADVTIQHGSSPPMSVGGGGIYNDHSILTVSGCILNGNSAVRFGDGGGIYNDGESSGSAMLSVIASTLTGNSSTGYGGGGIRNNGQSGGDATLLVIASTIRGNSAAGNGGGILNDAIDDGSATLEIVNSTISGNSADFNGGGIHNDGRFDGSATLEIVNSTISGNSAGDKGGGISNEGTVGVAKVEIGSVILNIGSSGVNLSNQDGTVTSLGYNLSSDAAGGDGTTGPGGLLNAMGDIRNTNPLLGPLQYNSVPTPNHAPLCGSPAIDVGKNFSGSATDQRGAQRTFDLFGIANATGGDGTDIGAVESPVFVFTVLNTDNSGAGSLRQAILHANEDPVTDIIDFDAGVTGTITLTSGELLITDCLFINGPGATKVVVSGNDASRVFRITPGIEVIISGLSITKGNASSSGGGILNGGSTVTVSDCALVANSADERGGAIYNDDRNASATLEIVRSTIAGNWTRKFGGGGIHNGGNGGNATLSVIACTISGNAAGENGGGIRNEGRSGSATLSVIASTISGNSAEFVGGGIHNDGNDGNATLSVIASTISGNAAGYHGGGIGSEGFRGSGTLSVIASTISGNSARLGVGGGIFNHGLLGVATLEIGNTILNVGGGSGANIDLAGTVTSLGFNLSSDGTGPNNGSTDLLNIDPLLGPLQDNGGPTFTHELLTGSPAIDMGNPNFTPPPDDDQRGVGYPRVVNGRIDIGSFEVQATAYAAQVQQPINADGTSAFNVRRGVVPVKFTLRQDGVATCALPPATIALTRTAGGTGQIDESVYTGSADTGSNFRISSCQYIYNLSASALGVGTYRVDILIAGQIIGSATFQLK